MRLHGLKYVGLFAINLSLFSCTNQSAKTERLYTQRGVKQAASNNGSSIMARVIRNNDTINNDFIRLRLSMESNGKTPANLNENSMYENYEIAKDIFLVDGQDTLMPLICQRIPGMNKNNYEYELAFEKNVKSNTVQLFINDKYLGVGKGIINFLNNELK